MGSFFTNVHARAPDGKEEACRSALVALLTSEAKAQGMAACGEGDSPDRSIIVGPPGRWIAIYDEATEDQALEPLDDLARRASRAVDGPAVAALVHDSDELLLRLFLRGQLVDEIVRGSESRGDPARWEPLCGPKLAELRAVLARRDLLKQQTLADIAPLLGLDARSACTGYRYAVADNEVPPGSTVLRFRSAVRPAHEQPASGPVRFVAAAWSPTAENPVGGAVHLHASVRNEGGTSRGLLVVVHGPAIEAGLVTLERAVVVAGGSSDGVVVEKPLAPRANPNGKPGFAAEFADLPIPAGSAGGMESLAGLGPAKMVQRMYASNVTVNVHGRGASAGRAPVFISLVPLEHREPQFQFHHAIELTIAGAPRKPLRAERGANEWVALEKPDVLVALASSTLDRREAARFAAEAFLQWRAFWPEDLVFSCGIHEGGGLERPVKPGKAELRPSKIEKGAAWKKVRAAFDSAARVTGMNLSPEACTRGRVAGDGFDFGGHLLGKVSAEDPDLATLRLAVDLRGRSSEEVSAMVSRARSIVDAFVREAACAQAFLARWQTGTVFDTTPYESACGVHSEAPLRRSWCTRFLRGVSADGVWMGADLLARIDASALEPLVASAPVGEALRIVPRDGVTLDAIEQILAPILPSGEDWKRWLEWIYGRAPRPT